MTTGRPLDAYLSIANPTPAPMDVVFRLTFSTGRTRNQRETVPVGESWGAKVRSLAGSQMSDPTTTITGLTVTCAGGSIACPVYVTLLAAPTCVGAP